MLYWQVITANDNANISTIIAQCNEGFKNHMKLHKIFTNMFLNDSSTSIAWVDINPRGRHIVVYFLGCQI